LFNNFEGYNLDKYNEIWVKTHPKGQFSPNLSWQDSNFNDFYFIYFVGTNILPTFAGLKSRKG